MLNGLDLFSGIGGLSIALNEWVRPIAHCEIDPYCQGVLLNLMANGELHRAPIWNDVRTLQARELPSSFIDILYGGFPCQDISVAGLGRGLEGERSGLFFEMLRLAKEIKPPYIFLENVPAITARGGTTVVKEITEMGYDCRWCVISAASVGALHRRERWFLLGYAKHYGRDGAEKQRGSEAPIPDSPKGENKTGESKGTGPSPMLAAESVADSNGERSQDWDGCKSNQQPTPFGSIHQWQEAVCSIRRVDDGVPNRVDRIRALGNAVVPIQAKEAFKILMGLN
jgi:DNA (cytosine-5)-methyltransferase 1